ncbi:MAG: hypothetical protein HQM09_21890 [Candidatus Riflebacteria bacterium]|nr:hypothetical protein [Candidatus Riflebacteria bacterium]
MTEQNKYYRTLFSGTIIQQSALSIGGSDVFSDADDPCFRDGRNRLTIPGTSLAGALIETLMRLFPDFGVAKDVKQGRKQGDKISGKSRNGLPSGGDEKYWLSVLRFKNLHLPVDRTTEWRQGVGIRQATGGAAKAKKALFDFEVVPAGSCWEFFLDLDIVRGGEETEAMVISALNEWVEGRTWLGRNAVRGTGWIRLESPKIVRLPLKPEMICLYPDNTRIRDDSKIIEELVGVGAEEMSWQKAVQWAGAVCQKLKLRKSAWCYMTINVGLNVGEQANGFGLNPMQVGGHCALGLAPQLKRQLFPFSLKAIIDSDEVFRDKREWEGANATNDKPFSSTGKSGNPENVETLPFLPGSGVRGAFRHTVSRLERMRNRSNGVPAIGLKEAGANDGAHIWGILDPNVKEFMLEKAIKQLAGCQPERKILLERDIRASNAVPLDSVVRVFGFEKLSSRILFRDASLIDDKDWLIVKQEQHAEDEFAAGVFGTSKFNADALMKGHLGFQIVIEAPDLAEMKTTLRLLAPSLELARLGHLPMGGGKWKGCGWIPWDIREMALVQLNGKTGRPDDGFDIPVDERFSRLLEN